jgi:acetyl-CoA carboxylase carboxyl transferase subunit alpha
MSSGAKTARAKRQREPGSEAAIAAGVRFIANVLGEQAASAWQAAINGDNNSMDKRQDPEQDLERIEKQIEQLETVAGPNQDAKRELQKLHSEVELLRRQIFAHMHAWQKTELARHQDRPYLFDYIERIFPDFSEIHGDRQFADDHAMVCGMARFHGEQVCIIGQQKGRDVKQRVFRNWGQPNPEGYRKALRCMRFAEKFGRPILTIIDTPGAYPGLGAEERGQAEAIARNLREMARLEVPIIATVTGEGGSGGALAIAVADRVLMLENSIYSVISPEGCASIMWRDPKKKDLAAEALKITADDLNGLGIIDAIIPEPSGGAHSNHDEAAALLDKVLYAQLTELKKIPPKDLPAARYDKFRKMAQFFS